MRLQKNYLIFLLLIILASFTISKHFYQIVLIQGNSMSPSYYSFQLALIDKRTDTYTYGTVVAIYCPALQQVIVKRIIALPGDTLYIADGSLYINNVLNSSYTNISNTGIASTPITLSDNEYFVMGDNFEQSTDSRNPQIGAITYDNIIGTLIPQKPFE